MARRSGRQKGRHDAIVQHPWEAREKTLASLCPRVEEGQTQQDKGRWPGAPAVLQGLSCRVGWRCDRRAGEQGGDAVGRPYGPVIGPGASHGPSNSS